MDEETGLVGCSEQVMPMKPGAGKSDSICHTEWSMEYHIRRHIRTGKQRDSNLAFLSSIEHSVALTVHSRRMIRPESATVRPRKGRPTALGLRAVSSSWTLTQTCCVAWSEAGADVNNRANGRDQQQEVMDDRQLAIVVTRAVF